MKTFIKKNKAKFLIIFIVFFATIQQKCTCNSDPLDANTYISEVRFTEKDSDTRKDTFIVDLSKELDTIYYSFYPSTANMYLDEVGARFLTDTLATFIELNGDQQNVTKSDNRKKYIVLKPIKTGISQIVLIRYGDQNKTIPTYCYMKVVNSSILPTSVTIMEVPTNYIIGQSFTFQGYVTPSNATNSAIYWSSSDTTIVSINKTTGVSSAKKAGTVTITAAAAAASSVKATKSVIVASVLNVAVTSITLSDHEKSISEGDTYTLLATIAPPNATNKNITWKSGNQTIVTVDNNGVITAIKQGQTKVKAVSADGNFSDSCLIIVNPYLPWNPGTLFGSFTGSNQFVKFIKNSTTGYVIRDNADILKTTDGVAWTSLANNKNSIALHFPSENVGYIVGNFGVVYKTSDAGKTWATQTSGLASTTTLNSVYFTSELVGFAVGSYGTMIKTTDGGTTWSSSQIGTTSDLTQIVFTSSQIGYVVTFGGDLLKTTDGGTTWTSKTISTNPRLSISFANENIGYIADGSTIWKTTDAGATWSNLNVNPDYTPTIIDFFDASNGIAVGNSGSIISTTDGGATWTKQTVSTTNNFTSISFPTINKAYAVGESGTYYIYKSK